MDIHIGIRNVGRELSFESEETADAVQRTVETALGAGAPVVLDDAKGRRFIIPADALGYIEVGATEARRVGFGV